MRIKKQPLTLIYPLLGFLILALLLLFERRGITYTIHEAGMDYIPQAIIDQKKSPDEYEKNCLIISDKGGDHDRILEQALFILEEMRVGYDLFFIQDKILPDLNQYATVMVNMDNLNNFYEGIFTLCDWVEEGGRVLFLASLDPTGTLLTIEHKLGIQECGGEFAAIHGLRVKEDFMIGGEGMEFQWDEVSESALEVYLMPEAKVYITSNDEREIPLLWSYDYGDGRFIVNNHGMAEKSDRGLLWAAYSMLEDYCIYPVINASTWFLDDFPAPMPIGNNEYVSDYYNRDIASFYTTVWWRDMLELAAKYEMKYTGMVIVDYNDDTDKIAEINPDIERFQYFGNLILDMGGEIGIHGYNHMPLAFDYFDFGRLSDEYHVWETRDLAVQSIGALIDFTEKVYPGVEPSVYVPPSNIMSEEARELMAENYPQIKTYASLYIGDELTYNQEFTVLENGIIEYPRIISGVALDDYMRWDALGELNFHYVNSHFMHPDDTLDEDRGAAMGWEWMKASLEEYIDWLYTSAPDIRNLTGTESAMAVQRFYALDMTRTWIDSDTLQIDFEGFYDEAYCMLRAVKSPPTDISGGEIQQIYSNLYLVQATEPQVTITFANR